MDHVGELKLEFAAAGSLSFHIHIAHSPSFQRRVLGYVIQHRQRTLVESKVRIGRKGPSSELFRPVIFKTFPAMQRGVAFSSPSFAVDLACEISLKVI